MTPTQTRRIIRAKKLIQSYKLGQFTLGSNEWRSMVRAIDKVEDDRTTQEIGVDLRRTMAAAHEVASEARKAANEAERCRLMVEPTIYDSYDNELRLMRLKRESGL